MTRTTPRLPRRRAPRLESLESRELLTAGGPTDQQQYALYLLNQARGNPAQYAERVTQNLDADVQATLKFYNVDLDKVKREISSIPAQPPLAWNGSLAAAAQGHSDDMARNGFQSHTGSDGSDLNTRLDRAGYGSRTAAGENAYAYSKSVDEAMRAFMIDWGVDSRGHRHNILQPGSSGGAVYREAGVGITETDRPAFGPLVITQNFGARADSKPQIVGVAFNDRNNNDAYDPGEGQGDVTIDARNLATGAKSSVQTWDSGGYQMELAPGDYEVKAKVGGKTVKKDRISVGSQNVGVDYNLSRLAPVDDEPAVAVAAAPVQASLNAAPAESAKPSTPPPSRSAANSPSTPSNSNSNSGSQASTSTKSPTTSNSSSSSNSQAPVKSSGDAAKSESSKAADRAFDSSWITSWITWKN